MNTSKRKMKCDKRGVYTDVDRASVFKVNGNHKASRILTGGEEKSVYTFYFFQVSTKCVARGHDSELFFSVCCS